MENIFYIKTRSGVDETKLTLVDTEDKIAKYRFENDYPYSIHGDLDNIVAIDFSETNMICLGDTINNMIVEKICPPYIMFKEK